MTRLFRRCFTLALAVVALRGRLAESQFVYPAQADPHLGFGDRASNVAINSAIGGVIGATRALIMGRSVALGLKAGLASGAVMGAGKQFAAASWNGSALLGRSVSQLGVSIESAAHTDTMRYAVPLGPFMLEWTPSDEHQFRTYVDVAEMVVTVYDVTRPHTRVDFAASLATGTPVLRRSNLDSDGNDGIEGELLIILSDPKTADSSVVLRHERVHVLQDDEIHGMIGQPIEDWLVTRLHGPTWTFGGAGFPLIVRLGVVTPLVWLAGNVALSYQQRPWEQEAYYLTEGPNWRSNYDAPMGCSQRCPPVRPVRVP